MGGRGLKFVITMAVLYSVKALLYTFLPSADMDSPGFQVALEAECEENLVTEFKNKRDTEGSSVPDENIENSAKTLCACLMPKLVDHLRTQRSIASASDFDAVKAVDAYYGSEEGKSGFNACSDQTPGTAVDQAPAEEPASL